MPQLSSVGRGMNPAVSGDGLLVPTVTYQGGTQQRLGQALGYYNMDKPRSLAYRALLRSGLSFTQAHLGDSTTVGVSDTDLRSDAPPEKLAAILTARGRAAVADSFMGDANFGNTTNYLAYNTLMNAFQAGWSVSGTESLGGKAFTNSSSAGDINFIPATACNAVDVLSVGVSHTFRVRFGGVDQATIVASTQPLKTRVTFINGGTVVAFRRVSGSVFIVGSIARNTATPRIDIANIGRSGSGSVFWSDNSSSIKALNCLPLIGAEVVFINQLIGDWGTGSGLTAAQTKANKKVYIDKIIEYGGIPVLVIPHPTPISITSAARQLEWSDVDYELSDEYGCALIDIHAHFGHDNQNLVDAGYMFDVSSHVNAACNQNMATYMADFIDLLAA